MRVFLTGDTHGILDIGKLSEKNFPLQRSLTKEDYLVVLGDFGGVWFGDEKDGHKYIPNGYVPHPKLIKSWGGDARLLDEYEKSSYTTLFIDGNHENHRLLSDYPVSEWHGGKVHFIRPSVIHLMRGQIYDFNGNTVFTMGGAASTDVASRVPDYSWFEEELPSEAEYEETLNNLAECNYEVDYIFTHC